MTNTFKIRGTVKEAETGTGVAGLFVKAYDEDLLFDDLLGSAHTGEDGSFEIVSEAEDSRDFFEVIFHDISGYGVASPPDAPIQFDAASWVSLPGIRRPTSAHELFHKLQYSFGYRTTWTPDPPFQWFSEGTASWSKVFVWQRVSGSYNITGLFGTPDLNLYNAGYSALPFWIFFQTRQQDAPDDNPFISFLQKYDATGDEKAALAEVIDEDWPSNNVYGQLDTFFALFSCDRRLGSWRQTPVGAQPYATILGPDSTPSRPRPIVPLNPLQLSPITGRVSHELRLRDRHALGSCLSN